MTVQVDAFESADCITSTYGTLVRHLGGEPAIFGSQWGFRPGRKADVEWPFERLNASRRSPCELMADWYDLQVVWTHHPDWDAATRQIRATLDAGQPAVVVADAFCLPYCWQFGKQHSPHRIVLTAYGVDSVVISDGYRGSRYEGALALDDLCAAMTSDGLLFPRRMFIDGRNTVITVPVPDAPLTEVTAEHTRRSLRENVTEYLSAGRAHGDGSGHDLLLRCAAEIRADAAGLAQRTKTDVAEISAWFGGMASQRALNAAFLTWAADLLAAPSLKEHADRSTALSRQWEKVRNYLYIRLSAQDRPGATVDGTAAVERVAGMVEETAVQEFSWCRGIDAELHRPARSGSGQGNPQGLAGGGTG
ncbi:BtrH N-terminal domain-containing protein [Plantactinospora sp. CA-290183]|uniref:BtrH N-terminal domain-containing protein n=1 Tax=Plantactinospora sp. CA-290183 TaxID=3240006 RepID=UPI003D8C43FA